MLPQSHTMVILSLNAYESYLAPIGNATPVAIGHTAIRIFVFCIDLFPPS